MATETPPWRQCELSSFDRQARLSTRIQEPQRYRELADLAVHCPRIARGGGVSYVAASFARDAVSQNMRAFDHLLAFDPERGTLSVEAGASIASVQAFGMRHGWYLAIAPGHPRASVGGCIAANVHGKNPARDGCFDAQVDNLRLFHPGFGWRDAPRDGELWRATCGGFGLTGSIVSAALQLRRAPRSIEVRYVPVADLAETAVVLREHADALLVYGWHDGCPAHFGRGAIQVGTALEDAAAESAPADTTSLQPQLPAQVPPWPLCFWNRATLTAANLWFSRRWLGQRTCSMAALLTPLNDARPYFAAFGPAGMIESQWLLPHASFEPFAYALAALVRKHRPLITLISSKLFAGQSFGPAFNGDGIALALHLPANSSTHRFLSELDELALAHGGRPNPIKQSGLDAKLLAQAIPDLAHWRACVAAHNPSSLYRSELSRHLQW